MNKLRSRRGFTLAELAIVLAVIAILIIIVVPNLGKIVENSEGSSALSEAKDLYAQYVIDNTKEGTIDRELYVEVEDGYVFFKDGDPQLNGELHLVETIYINDDVLSSSCDYVESKFKTHESIKQEYLKDFKAFAKTYGYKFDSSDPLNIMAALTEEAAKIVDLTKGDQTVKVSIAEAFILKETNEKKYVKWSWLYDLIKEKLENENLDNETIIGNVCEFLTNTNTFSETGFDDYYKLIPRDIFLKNVDTETPKYELSFELNDGSWEEESVFEYEENEVVALGDLSVPVKNGYNFQGWYSTETFEEGSNVTSVNISENTKLYAKWDIVTYSIYYDFGNRKVQQYNNVSEIRELLFNKFKQYTKNNNTSVDYSLMTIDEFFNRNLWGTTDEDNVTKFLYDLIESDSEWKWFIDYCQETTKLYYTTTTNGQTNDDAWSKFYVYGSYNGVNNSNYLHSFQYIFKAFIAGKQYEKNSANYYYSPNYGDSYYIDKLNDYVLITNGINTYNVTTETFYIPVINNSNFGGWYIGEEKIQEIVKGTYGDIILTAKWKDFSENYVNSILLSYYSNTGMAASDTSLDKSGSIGNRKNYICDKVGIDPSNKLGNSLRYQNKILLYYESSKNAYRVVAVDGKTKEANSMGVTWTHAICSISNDIHNQVKVGQYIVIDPVQDFSSYHGIDNKDFALTNTYARIYNADQWQ